VTDDLDGASGPSSRGRSPLAERLLLEGYLAGREKELHTVQTWVLTEIGLRYPWLRDEREDLAQRVHEKLLVSLRGGRFRHESTLRTFVTSIVHHTCIDAIRKRYLPRLADETGGTEPDQRASDWGNPYLDLEERETTRILHRVLHLSSESCRRLWRMIFFDRIPYDEIAARLLIPSGTVKSRVFNCRQKALGLYRKLTGRGGQEKQLTARRSDPERGQDR
jgi:RNA polymerase sigma factor (sigma-70 family)